MIVLKLFLHGRPDWHLPLQGSTKLNPASIKLYADHLKGHLYRASSLVELLQRNGWYLLESYGAIYYLEYCKFEINSDQAKSELDRLGVNNQVIIEELNLEDAY